MHRKKHTQIRLLTRGFTLVELMIVIAVLAVLAGISVVGYGKWRESVARKEVQSDLQMAAVAMENVKNFGSGYPNAVPTTFTGSPNVALTYGKGSSAAYCVQATSTTDSNVSYYVSSLTKKPLAGNCTNVDLTVVADAGSGSSGGGSTTAPEPEQPPQQAQPPTNLSDSFSGSGPLGVSETGNATWEFINGTSSQWTRNGGYATFTPGSANAIAAVTMAQADNDIVASWSGLSGAIYARVVDGTNWYRLRAQSGSEPSSNTTCIPIDMNDYTKGYNCTTTDTTISYTTLNLQKSVNGTITTLQDKKMYNTSVPAYMRLTVKGSSLTVKYGSANTTTSTAYTVTDASLPSSGKVGIGGPNTTSGWSTVNDAKVDSIAVTPAP